MDKKARHHIPSEEETSGYGATVVSKKTKEKTKQDLRCLQSYMEALCHPKTSNLDELTPTELQKVMLKFVIGVRKVDGTQYEPGSIQSCWYSVKRHFGSLGMDMKALVFDAVAKQLRDSVKGLRQSGGGRQPNAADPLTSEEISYFFTSRVAGPHHPKALANAIIMFTMMLGRRGYNETYSLKFGDLFVTTVNGHQFLELGDITSKNYKSSEHRPGAQLAALDDLTKCPVHLFNLYCLKRPATAMHPLNSALMLSINTRAPKDIREDFTEATWYVNQNMGLSKVGGVVKEMVRVSELEVGRRKISNYSIRKNCVTTLKDAGLSDKTVMHYTGHKDPSSLTHYDTMNSRKASHVTGLLLNSSATYEMFPPPPILLSSPIPHLSQPSTSSKKRLPIPSAPLRTSARKRPPSPCSKGKGPSTKSQKVSSTSVTAATVIVPKETLEFERKKRRITFSDISMSVKRQMVAKKRKPVPVFIETNSSPSAPKISPPRKNTTGLHSTPPPSPISSSPFNTPSSISSSPLYTPSPDSTTSPILTPAHIYTPAPATQDIVRTPNMCTPSITETNTSNSTNAVATSVYNGPVTINNYHYYK